MQANVQWQSRKRFLLIRLATDTHTHTQKEMDLVGLYLALQLGMEGELRVRVWPGTWPPRAVLPTRTHHGETRTHDPESNEPTILTATNDDRRHEHQHDHQPPRNPEKDQDRDTPPTNTGYSSQSFLFLPPGGWRDPL